MGDGLIFIFYLNWIFDNILNNYYLLIFVIIHNQLNLLFFELFIKLESSKCVKTQELV